MLLENRTVLQAKIEELQKKAEMLNSFGQKAETLHHLLTECFETVKNTELEADFKKSIADIVFNGDISPGSKERVTKKRHSSKLTYREEIAIKDEVKAALRIEKQRVFPKRVIEVIFDKYGADELVQQLTEEAAIASTSKDWSNFWLMARDGIKECEQPSDKEAG